MIDTVLVEDNDVFREALELTLALAPDIRVVGATADGREALTVCSRTRPDVVVMDVRMPEVDGVTATRLLRAAGDRPPVLVLTTFEDDEVLAGALRAGAAGFLLKGVPADDLQRAVRTVAAGGSWLDPAVTGRVLAAYRDGPVRRAPDRVLDVLTAREREVLDLVAAGRNNAQIAATLYLSPKTVRNNVSNVLTKLQVADRAEAIVRAREAGLGR